MVTFLFALAALLPSPAASWDRGVRARRELCSAERLYSLHGYREALIAHERALVEFRKAGETTGETAQVLERGFALAALGRHDEALAAFRQAGPRATSLDNTWRWEHGRARVLIAQGDVDGAAAAYRLAIERIEQQPVRCRVPEFQSSFLGDADRLQVYDEAIELLAGKGRVDDAIELIERERAHTFLSLEAGRPVSLSVGVDPNLLADERRLSERVIALSQAVERQRVASQESRIRDSAEALPFSSDLTRARDEHCRCLKRITTKSPSRASLDSVKHASGRELQAELEPGEQVLLYYVGSIAPRVFLIERGCLLTAALPVSPRGLRELARVFSIQLEQRLPFEVIARQLYDILIGPVEKDLAGRHIIVAPHDVLHCVPFQTLVDTRGHCLIDRCPISYTPSVAALLTLHTRDRTLPRRAGVDGTRQGAAGLYPGD
jgi:hypothetical protein